jgi:cell division protease FtsH
VLARRHTAADAREVAELEELIPHGVFFHGPGTGKRLFARALAGTLGAALLATPGPELKSPQFGGSEEKTRQVIHRASMLAQLLAEMDRLPCDQMVFVAGTTRALDRLDPALLRPSRFELHLEIPYPDADDRRAILELYDRRFRLRTTAEALGRAVMETAGEVQGGPAGCATTATTCTACVGPWPGCASASGATTPQAPTT